jgi:glycosyltransferase involved in cell wall biosynthesis
MGTISPDIFYTADFLSYIKETITLIKPDIIQTEFYNNQNLIYELPDNIKKIFVQHEIRRIINEQRLEQQQDEKLKLIRRYTYSKLAADEVTAMNHYNVVFTLTDVDKSKLLESGVAVPIYSSPVGIAMEKTRNTCNFQNKLIFVGGSNHTPNVLSLNWFLNNVWKQVLSENPQIMLYIVGDWSKKLIKQIKTLYPRVEFKGFVPSLKSEYDGAISIVPIIRGSGMRMKIIDAVNYGSPFITTSIGSEGLLYEDGKDCFIADTPNEFCAKLCRLINDEKKRQEFYENSYVVLQTHYSMNKLVMKRLSYYQEIVRSE